MEREVGSADTFLDLEKTLLYLKASVGICVVI